MKRRTFLRGVGGAALAAPFLPSLVEKSAKAQDLASNPRRMVIFYTQNGCLTNRWFPSVEDGAIDANALAGTTLEPLQPYASKLLFPRGLACYPQYGRGQSVDPHDQGMGCKLTCAPLDTEGEHWAQGRSLDHVAAELVNQGSSGPLVLSVGNAFANVKGIVSYSAVNEPYSPETSPTNVYSNLTGLFVGGEAQTTDEGSWEVSRGNSIIDLVRQDLDAMNRLNMSQADKQRVSDWLDLLRETEQQVTVTAACNADSAAVLGLDDSTVGGGNSGGGFGGGFVDTATAFTEHGDQMIKLIALTMMCDANRSIVFQWPGFVTFNWDGIAHDYDHHGLSHRNGSAAVGGTCVSGVIDSLNEIDQWYAGRYTQLVSLIDSIVEGDKTMLDNSAVAWIPELADGNAHNNNNLPVVIAGSGGGYLKQGAAVNVDGGQLGTGNSEASCSDGNNDVSFNTGSNGGTVPVNKLYVTLLNALGATSNGGPVTEFGLWDNNSGGISDPGELSALKA